MADNLWAWIDEESDPEPVEAIDSRMVAAVMVVHNAEEWLPRQLRALAALNPRPAMLVAVDNGSTDSSRHLLEKARASGIISGVIDGDKNLGFGAAVVAAIPPDAPWIWLLGSSPQRVGAAIAGSGQNGGGSSVPEAAPATSPQLSRDARRDRAVDHSDRPARGHRRQRGYRPGAGGL